jgi:hypothetical protein
LKTRCWLAGEDSEPPGDHPPVTDDYGRTWVHVEGELYRERYSGQCATFTELVRRTDLVEVT